MGKKLTDRERRDREVGQVVSKIIKLEKVHDQGIVESACVKYKTANVDKRKAAEEIVAMEEKLADAKRRLKK